MSNFPANPHNSVILRTDGIIEVKVVGDQNAKTVTHMGAAIEKLIRQQQKANLAVLVFDDIRQMGKTDSGARGVLAQLSRQLDFDRLAMLGDGSMLMRHGTNFIIRAIGKGNSIHYFDDEQTAMRWLRDG